MNLAHLVAYHPQVRRGASFTEGSQAVDHSGQRPLAGRPMLPACSPLGASANLLLGLKLIFLALHKVSLWSNVIATTWQVIVKEARPVQMGDSL